MIRLLIAEDEEIIRKALVYTIDWLSLGCTVAAEAANGEEGLQKIRELSPDLVITDIKMPRLDGIEMIAQGRREREFESIIITSYGEFDYAREAIGLGVTDYILKPIDEEKLCQAVQRAAERIGERRRLAALGEGIRQKVPKPAEPGEASYYVRLALEAVKRDYKGHISVESVARELNVSPSYLSRRFKAEVSQTFTGFLNRYRVQRAAELLEQGNRRVYEVSDEVGFADYKNFCAVFKKYTQMTPTEFMRRVGGK